MAERGGDPRWAPLISLVGKANREQVQREIARAKEYLDRVESEHCPERALMVARNKESLAGHGLVIDLLRRAEGTRSCAPDLCRQWAEAAVERAAPLGSPGLSAQGWAEKANAERILEDYAKARASFDRAHEILQGDDGGLLSVRANVLSLEASLEDELGRRDEALACLEEALSCYRKLDMKGEEARVLVQRADVYSFKGLFRAALGDLGAVLRWIRDHPQDAPFKTTLAACHNFLAVLAEVALSTESEAERREALDDAFTELPAVRQLSRALRSPSWSARLRWVEGRLYLAEGWLGRAQAVLDQVVADCLELGLNATAAAVSLDLALVLARKRELGELRAVAGAACVVLEAAGLKPSAWAAQRLLLDCDLAEAETVIVGGLQRARCASLRRTPGIG